jgi:hypothetical protein
MNTSTLRRAATILAAAAALIVISDTPSLAGPSPRPDRVQQEVDAYRLSHPGGKQISATEISYRGGAFIVAVVRPANTPDGADCPSGWFCFYDGTNFVYPRGRLSSCGWQDLSWYGWSDRTESAHYNLASGQVWFIDHSGADHSDDTPLSHVDADVRARYDMAPHRNMADHVYRYC